MRLNTLMSSSYYHASLSQAAVAMPQLSSISRGERFNTSRPCHLV